MKVEMQEMLDRLLARMDASTKGMREDMKAVQERAEADRKTEREEMEHKIRAYKEQMLNNMEANREIDWEERSAERKADQENPKRVMEEIMTANQAKTDVKLKELTETIEKHIWNARSQPQQTGRPAKRRPPAAK
jgi:hypothetical protein